MPTKHNDRGGTTLAFTRAIDFKIFRMLVRNDQAAISADFRAGAEAQLEERRQQESMSTHFRSYVVLLDY
jgi:hypothetical protein